MANNGFFYGTTANTKIKPKITWSAVQSVEGNYSDITATLSYSRTNTGYTTGGTWEGTLTIGDRQFSGSKYIEITYDSNTVAITGTARVSHDSYGSASVKLAATGGIVSPAGSTLKTTDISGTVTPEPIPRASTVSAVNGDIGSRATVVVSRKNDSFTHSIAYRFGDLSGYIDAEGNPVASEVKLSGTTVNFLLPEEFYGQIPHAPSGVCTLTCRTYWGDTRIGGEQTAEFTATADYESCKPRVSGRVEDVNEVTAALTGDPNVLVRYASIARCTVAAQAQNYAEIAAVRIGGVTVEGDVLDIVNPAFDTLSFEAVDTRGYTTVCQVPVTLIPYVPLTNNATVQRKDPTSGEAVLTLQGNCWQGSFGKAENALQYTCSINDADPAYGQLTISGDNTYGDTLHLTGLDYQKAHTIQLDVTDSVMTAPRTLPVQKGIPVFDWGETDFRFHVPVDVAALTIGGVPLETYVENLLGG